VDGERQRLQISTTAEKYSEVQTWIKEQLAITDLSYAPSVLSGPQSKNTKTPTSKSIYSKKFTSNTTTSDGSFDSTIKTAPPNPWYKARPVPLEIDFSADPDAFPPLPAHENPKAQDSPTITSKTTFTDDHTIKTAILSATREIEAHYEQKLQDLSNSITAKLRQLEAAVNKFEEMDSKLDLLLDRMFSLNSDAGYTPTTSTPTKKNQAARHKIHPLVHQQEPIRRSIPPR
jgi:hypothetical protein